MGTSWYEQQKSGYLNDTVVLDAYLYSNDGSTLIPQSEIGSVSFSVMRPTDPDGSPTLLNQTGQIIGDGHGQIVVPGYVNNVAGHYRAAAVFIYQDGDLANLNKTIPVNYEIEDPFAATGSSPADPYVDQAWQKLVDCFDTASDGGGPWLREMTLDVFDKYKMRTFLPEVLLVINTQEMPYSNYTEATFPYTDNDGGALLAQGLLVSTVRHLMRSYAEQPNITNSPVTWENRLNYQSAWNKIYEIELNRFDLWLKRWKLRDYDISHGSLLVASKAGRLLAGPFRSRGYGFGRGW